MQMRGVATRESPQCRWLYAQRSRGLNVSRDSGRVELRWRPVPAGEAHDGGSGIRDSYVRRLARLE